MLGLKPVTAKDVASVRYKLNRAINIILTIASVVVVIVCAFMLSFNKIDRGLAGVLIPGAILVYLLMGLLSNIRDDRKPVMIIYIVCMVIAAVVLFFDAIYFNMG